MTWVSTEFEISTSNCMTLSTINDKFNDGN